MVKRGVRGIYEVLWYDTGAGEVRSLVNRALVAEYTPGLGWEDHGRLPDDIREYAQQIASAAEGASVVPHHETSGRSEAQRKKSHAQIKREVDEILKSGPHRDSSGHATKITPRPFYEIEPDDIGKRFLRAFGRGWALSDVLGYVQHGDVGKRLYLVDGILQVENNEQRDARVRKSS